MKFKKGDVVRIKTRAELIEYAHMLDDDVIEFSDMADYGGKTATITRVCATYYYLDIDNCTWMWYEELIADCIAPSIVTEADLKQEITRLKNKLEGLQNKKFAEIPIGAIVETKDNEFVGKHLYAKIGSNCYLYVNDINDFYTAEGIEQDRETFSNSYTVEEIVNIQGGRINGIKE